MSAPTATRVAVVGAGAFGRNHLRVYRDLEQEPHSVPHLREAKVGLSPAVKLVAVVDPNPATSQTAAEKYEIPAFPSVEALLASGLAIDAASICVPTIHHLAAAEPLLRAGIDLLIEKPLAATLAEADTLIALAAASGRLIQTGHLERFNPAVTAARALLQPAHVL